MSINYEEKRQAPRGAQVRTSAAGPRFPYVPLVTLVGLVAALVSTVSVAGGAGA